MALFGLIPGAGVDDWAGTPSTLKLSMKPAQAPQESPPCGPASRRRLGAGRSGQVFEEILPDGRSLACKVFLPDRASSLVNRVLTGAVNPYRWNAHAVECAVLRRRILAPLVQLWFQGALRLPETHGARWDEDHRAFELRAERVQGRHTQLQHSLGGGDADEVGDLVRGIMRPLQKHLAESGFDGLLWQAGKGNPVAAANYMRDLSSGPARWVWIDAESGVPALVPMAFWTLGTTYLPLCVKHRCWLFDDVDSARLERYIERRGDELTEQLGEDGYRELRVRTTELGAAQERWRALKRHERGVQSHLAAGKLPAEDGARFMRSALLWNGHLMARAAASLPRRAKGLAAAAWSRISLLGSLRGLATYGRFFLSRSRRQRWASHHVRRRILDWRKRGMLSPEGAAAVKASMTSDEAAEYVADFGVHLAIKPAVKVLTWGSLPLLALSGAADHWMLVGLIAISGALGRTAYTAGRVLQAMLAGRQAPWIALGMGALPVVGNAAFPTQLLAATRGGDGRVARFLVHDILTGIGRRLPIWGGADTLLEHGFNRVALALCAGGAAARITPLQTVRRDAAAERAKAGGCEPGDALERSPSLQPSELAPERPEAATEQPRR